MLLLSLSSSSSSSSYLFTSISLYLALLHKSLKIFSFNIFQLLYIADNPALNLITYIFFIAFITYLFIHDYICMQFYSHESLPPDQPLFIITTTCLRAIVFFLFFFFSCSRIDNFARYSLKKKKENENYPQ